MNQCGPGTDRVMTEIKTLDNMVENQKLMSLQVETNY
jgi:hypothetical protein